MPLQKSFSDQNHSSKRPRHRWQKNKSYSAPQSRNDSSVAISTDKGNLTPVSSATKNKLSMFQFGGQSNSNNENTATRKDAASSVASEQTEIIVVEEELVPKDIISRSGLRDGSQNELNKSKQNPPTTPAGRLALPDLIGMVDMRRVEQEISPNERIMWSHDASAPQSSASSHGALRGKKRARSSSPILGSPAQASAYFSAKGEAFDLHQLNQSLKTPQVDPGNELWGRYGLHAEDPSIQDPNLPALAHIMWTSSPQTSRQLKICRTESRLKRSIGRSNSCGTEWPTKRKRIVMEDQPEKDVFSEPFNVGPSKLSLVNALLGKFNDGPVEREAPNPDIETLSSSPIRTTKRSHRTASNSPLCSKKRQTAETVAEIGPSVCQVMPNDAGTTTETYATKSESDYGDFDEDAFEDAIIDEICAESAPPLAVIPLQVLNNESLVSLKPQHQLPTSQNPSSRTLVKNHEIDEFGDGEEDVWTADFEDIVAKYDSGKPVGDGAHDHSCQGALEPNIPNLESDDEYGDEFSDLDFEAVEAAEAAAATAATQSIQNLASSPAASTPKARTIQRYLVTTIIESEYQTPQGRTCPEKVVIVQVERSKLIQTLHLREDWFDTPVTPNAFVHVIGTFEKSSCVIDNANNMLILHPDHLISSTVLADSFTCMRRAVLQDRVKATNSSSPPLVYGTILHEIFQAALMANRWDPQWLGDLINSVAKDHLEDLYTIKIQLPHAVEHLQSNMGELQSWAKLFVSPKPKPDAVVKTARGESYTMCVSKLLDVEEHVWSPMYGLKGNVDATVQVTMNQGKKSRTLTVPLEVKTGRSVHDSHQIQTALYKLLLSDRYDVEVAYGILYYMQKSEMIPIPLERRELRHFIMQRNELACFVRERHAQLPPMLRRERTCSSCYAQVSCFIYHRLGDDGNGETSAMKDKFDKTVKHLTPKYKDFFLKWDDLLTKEEKESMKFKRELWTMCSSEREKVGRCFSNVIIEPGSEHEERENPKINRFRYTLIKQTPEAAFSFLESSIVVGEPIVISDEQGHFALANGYVTNVRKARITVDVDRRLHNARFRSPGFDPVDNQVFSGIMDVNRESLVTEMPHKRDVASPVQYRLDKDEFSNGMANVRNNLIQVMAEGPFGSRQVRNLVVDLVAPQFKPHSTAYTLTDRANINIDQRRAIEKVMSARDYALVLGMPGTGKTTTIAHIIRALVLQRKSVLLTSFTHTAVDNILLKLKEHNLPILRLGSASKINPDVQKFAMLADKHKTATFEDLRSLWHDTPVVATTCLGINHPLFNERTFDYCIVDEASQITLPVCLGPIRLAHTFVLVGDHYQLPPLVQNVEARKGGLDISLFKLLSDTHPSSVAYLEHQYRMCEDVMTLSNNLIYEGRLKCGTPQVATSCITIPRMESLKQHHFTSLNLPKNSRTMCAGPIRGQCWLRDLLDPSTKVSFINTDPLLPLSREEAKGNRIVNSTEAKICVQLVESLLSVGVPTTSIGVMTTYRSQISLLKHELRGHGEVEMHTADKFQGRDKEVIVLSLVRSNDANNIGDLLRDWRRINVAFTRAKTKLLVVGSKGTLKGSDSEEMVSKFVRLMEDKRWVYDLPKGALESHSFDDFTTQATCKTQSGTKWKETNERKETKKKSEGLSPRSAGKENSRPRPEPKRVKVSDRALLAGRPILRDIMNDSFGGL